ncbi:unnamed protein product [Gulo gulo]|uniref:Uncharacterized protein n=1 Tax=Gulo gulo TaxID=48420 RepID=A0A9X9LKN1_GULGU|nr:unnamed protein product [Gulo gulo]
MSLVSEYRNIQSKNVLLGSESQACTLGTPGWVRRPTDTNPNSRTKPWIYSSASAPPPKPCPQQFTD